MKLIDKFNGLPIFIRTLAVATLIIGIISSLISFPSFATVFLFIVVSACVIGLFLVLCYSIVMLIETF